MMFLVFQLLLVWLLLLYFAYLAEKRRSTAQQPQAGEAGPEEVTLIGKGFDTTVVSRRVAQVRHDYLAEIHSHPRCGRGRRQQMVRLAAQILERKPYFRQRIVVSETSKEPDSPANQTC
jgi:hypothetical protein